MPEWLERELARELAPVEAPDELWLRVRSGGPAVSRRKGRSPVLLLAAAAALLATVGAIWMWGSPVRDGGRQTMAQGSCYACHTSL
ncbi:MAG TPA: hypothetical protein VML19_09455 [Verrucomicrobiae bacterium]|nr:hypothetical protein [Verrucomicrobiae bacterium]